MTSTNRPLGESTATLVAPDDHLHAKDLLSTPTNTSTAVSSGTVSDEEPSTPEPLAGAPVSVLCGWPHEHDPKDPTAKHPKGRPDDGSGGWPHPGDSDKPDPAKWHTLNGTGNDGTDFTPRDDSVSVLCGWPDANGPDGKTGHGVTRESGWPHEDDPKDAAVTYSKAQPPVGGVPDNGSGDWPEPGDSSKDDPAKAWPDGNASKPDPAKLYTLKGTSSDGADSTSQDDDSASVLCGWPHVNGPRDSAAETPKGRPLVGGVPDHGSDLMPEPGDSSKPDPANGWPNGSRDFTSKGESGWPHIDDPEDQAAKSPEGWPLVGGVPGNGDLPDPGDPSQNDPAKIRPGSGSDQTQAETAGPERRRKPGTVGPEGQPPWGVKNLAATAANTTSLEGPEGQPPWGVKNLATTAANATSLEGPEGQPPWGVKNLATTAANATGGVAGPEGQPPWGIKNLAATADNATGGVASPEGQPPWGIKNLGAAVNATGGVAGPEGQPPWGVKNLAVSDGGPEGQPPWGTKGRAAATTTTTGGNEAGKGDDGAQDASA
ncbi:hypothetical protein MY3296_009222 [Beauveria thailandica]